MTVEELIEQLKNIDGKKDVYVNDDYGWFNKVALVNIDDDGDVLIE